MNVNKITIKGRLDMLISSKSENEKLINDLIDKAKKLKKRLQIETG